MLTAKKLLFAMSTLVLGCAATTAFHEESCSLRTLRGSFGYTVTGSIVTPFGPLVAGPFAAVGRIIFDGNGHATTVRSLSDNGNVLQEDAGTGTYTMRADCTGSFNITVGPPGSVTILTLNTVLDDTFELRGLVTNPGAVLVREGRPQSRFLY